MAEDRKTLSMLLVGGSGEGKSEFILSFINDEHRKKIPASGDGQTTRTSMVYTIKREESPLKIVMSIKSKEIFCLDRVNAFMSRFSSDAIEDDIELEDCKNAFINDDAFFNSNEFINSCATVEQKFDELFDKAFFDSIENESDDTGNGSDTRYICKITEDWFNKLGKKETLKNQYTIEDCLTCFSEWVYDICIAEIDEYLQANGIELQTGTGALTDISSLADKDDAIRLFIKAEDGKPSFSSLIETVCFDTYVAGYYQELFDSIRIKSCVFVDTYGLDHKESSSDEKFLKKRYSSLLREYPDIDTVLYIRKARSNPPTDLVQNIPPLYMVKPSIMSYIVFTHADNPDGDGKKTIDKMKNPTHKLYIDIYKNLKGEKVNPELSKMRIRCMAENIVEYCSKTGKDYNKKDYEAYIREHPKQVEQLEKLFLSIRDKKHLGSLLLNIDRISLDNVRALLNINTIFSEPENFYGYPGRTLGALGDRLQEGKLGFHSSTWDYFKYWDDEIFKHVRDRFLNISSEFEWAKLMESENVVPVIQSLFNEFMNLTIKCKRDPSRNLTNTPNNGLCLDCDCKEKCIQSIIYKNKEKMIDSKYYPVSQWLTGIYDFSSVDDNAKEQLQNFFDDLYVNDFIPKCREYNARVLASEMNNAMTEQQIEEIIEQYFDAYDSKLDEEDRVLFEQKVNQFFN